MREWIHTYHLDKGTDVSHWFGSDQGKTVRAAIGTRVRVDETRDEIKVTVVEKGSGSAVHLYGNNRRETIGAVKKLTISSYFIGSAP